jgi:beta-lactamase regulating signal transducer with metallopeptidase domain
VRNDAVLLLVDAAARATLVLAGGWALTLLMRRASASARHFAWMCAIVAAALMPAAAVVIPDWHVASLSRLAEIAASFESTRAVVEPRAVADTEDRGLAPAISPQGPTQTSSRPLDYSTVAGIIWLAGVAGVGLHMAAGVLAARWMRRRAATVSAPWVDEARVLAEAFDVPEPIDFKESSLTGIPMVSGVWRPAIVMPPGAAAWPPERLRVAVLHELAHIRRRDCGTQAVAQLVCALYWFNPLVWLAARRLRVERERACDDFVLEAGTQGSAYAAHLLEIARTMGPRIPAFARAGVAMAHRSQLEGRLMAILNPTVRRSTGVATRLTAVTAMLLVAVPVAAVQLQDTSSAGPDGQTEKLQRVVVLLDDAASLKAPKRGRAVDRALVEAAGDGDVQGVNDLLSAGANLDAAIAGDGSPLIAAAREGQLEIVRLLLDRGADPNLAVPGDGSPLIAAAREGQLEIVGPLLDRGADPAMGVPGDGSARSSWRHGRATTRWSSCYSSAALQSTRWSSEMRTH